MKLELDAPNIGEVEKRYLNKTIDSGFVSTYGPFVTEFEERFAKYLSVEKAVSTQSGTAAIHIALYELGLSKTDEVIVPALTFVATVNPVMQVGAKPVFADVDTKSWNIDPEEIEKCITKKTKAIIPVHLYGNPCSMDEIMDIAKKHRLFVIEDATESLGSYYKGRHTGTFGNLGCFSFNGNKTMTTGGGGMVVGNNKKRIEHIKFLVNQARDESIDTKSKGYYHPEIGFNYRMTNLEAALGLAQLERLDELLAKKRRINAIYRNELKNIEFINFQQVCKGADNICWLTCIVFKKKIRISNIQKKLQEKQIPTRRVFMPIVEFPPYKNYKHGNYKHSYEIYEKGLCLPSSTLNSEDDIRYVCKAIKELI